MRTWYVRHVLHEQIEDYLALGWMFGEIDESQHPTCSPWAVIMQWPCECKLREPG